MAMKSRKNLLAVLAVSVIAMAVAIAGCSSSSSDKSAGGTPPETPPTVAELFATAHTANTESADASEEAARVADKASEVKYGAEDVNGESNKAVENAQSVLSAQIEMTAAVKKAQTALDAADSAKEKAKAHEDENLNAALRAAIEAATAQVKAAKDSQNKLKGTVANVENPPDGTTDPAPYPPKTPAYHGDEVAKTIGMALDETLSISHSTMPPSVETSGAVGLDDDHSGVKWADIAGNVVMEMRIAFDGNANLVEAASIKGTTSVKGVGDGGSLVDVDEKQILPDAEIGDGLQLPGFWKGIEGIVFCQGKDCEVESGESGGFKLTGSWYFTPNLDDLDKLYVKKADESGDYEPALYAKYGHWLTFDDGVATVNTYAMTDHDNKGAWTVSTEPDATTLKDTSASYSGKAAGMSVRETFKTDGTVEKTQSGAFTAKVSLTATFGSSPELVGKVSQFEGAAVNTDWSVTLEKSTVSSGSVTATETNGVASASGPAGAWSATSYGNTDARPTGIYGNFNAHFSDGHAAGAYATRKQ